MHSARRADSESAGARVPAYGEPMRILVTGATGYVGSRLVAALLAEGHEVVVASSRNLDRLADFGWFDDVTPVVLDAARSGVGRQRVRDVGTRSTSSTTWCTASASPTSATPTTRPRRTSPRRRRTRASQRIVYLGGFVPDDDELSEHLTGRAEVADALTVDGGPEVVWLGAAIIIGAGSTSFEMLRYVGDRFLLIPMPPWADNPMDPISIRDVLYYLVAAADARPRAGRRLRHRRARDARPTATCCSSYARLSGKWRAECAGARRGHWLVSRVTVGRAAGARWTWRPISLSRLTIR